jgi:EmrB/QacA subfamily drug resistance transporter
MARVASRPRSAPLTSQSSLIAVRLGAVSGSTVTRTTAAAGAQVILLTLAAGQFLMALDSSVMNVSIATVAEDVGTTVTGIQGAITAYTLVMAMLMIPGAKVGALIGRKRAFMIGCVIYGCGSFTTALSQSLPVLLFGWSFLEGVGAALILPSIVALVAGNFPAERRPAAYGLVAAAGAIAIAVGPLVGGLATTYASWRWVFAGEVMLVSVILLLARRAEDAPPDRRPRIDLVGAFLCAAGLGVFVFGVLKSGSWGWVVPKSGAPQWFGMSPVPWLMVAGLVLVWSFLHWEGRLVAQSKEPLVDPQLLRNPQLRGGLTMFFFQYLLMMGVFFLLPLYLSVALGLSAIATGVRIMPLSLTLLAGALGVPRLFPDVSPRLVARVGIFSMLLGMLVLLAAIDIDAGAEIVTVPLLLVGLGLGALASQLGAVTVSAVPDEQSSEVGGMQNTVTNLGASLGTALAGSILIAVLTASFLTHIETNNTVPQSVKNKANTELSAGIPFMSDKQLQAATKQAGASSEVTQAALDANAHARLDGLRAGLTVLILIAAVALFFVGGMPTRGPGSGPAPARA